MSVSNLADLIAGAQSGDPAAFDELVDAYADRLYGYFYRLTGSQADSEDLLQDLFVRLVRAIKKYDHRNQFEAFLFRIASNLIRDRIRERRRSKETVRLDDSELSRTETAMADNLVDAGAASPENRLEQAETADRLQEALAKLSSAEREVIALRHFSDMPFSLIASVMDAPLGTVLARAHRGLTKLRVLMGSPT